jgi:hypothetical protein
LVWPTRQPGRQSASLAPSRGIPGTQVVVPGQARFAHTWVQVGA